MLLGKQCCCGRAMVVREVTKQGSHACNRTHSLLQPTFTAVLVIWTHQCVLCSILIISYRSLLEPLLRQIKGKLV